MCGFVVGMRGATNSQGHAPGADCYGLPNTPRGRLELFLRFPPRCVPKKRGDPSQVHSLHVAIPCGHPFDGMFTWHRRPQVTPSHSCSESSRPPMVHEFDSMSYQAHSAPQVRVRARPICHLYHANHVTRALLLHGTVRVVLFRAPTLPAGRLVPCSAHLNPPDGLQGVPSTWGVRRHPGHRAPSSLRSLYLGHGLRSAAFGCRLPTGVRSALCAVYAHDASLPLGGWGARCSPRRVRACELPCCPCVCCPRRLPSR